MTKKDDEDFENSTNFQICDNVYVDDDDVKAKDHCHITAKNRGSAHVGCNINVKLNHKIHVVFHNLKYIMIPILLCKKQANSILK